MNDLFRRFASAISRLTGHPSTFIIALGLCLAWLVSGPLFGYSDTWQLAINTATTVVTFLMVFVLQNTQNRDNAAIQLKLDEIVRSLERASNRVIDIEDAPEEVLAALAEHYRELRERVDRQAHGSPENDAS